MEFQERRTIIFYQDKDGHEHEFEIVDNPVISIDAVWIDGQKYVRGPEGAFGQYIATVVG